MKKTLLSLLFITNVAISEEIILEKNGITLTDEEVIAAHSNLVDSHKDAIKKQPKMLTSIMENLFKDKLMAAEFEGEVKKIKGYEILKKQNENAFITKLYITNKYNSEHSKLNFKVLAEQDYLANKEKYTKPATYDLYHVLFLNENNLSDIDPKEKATELYNEIKDKKTTIEEAAKKYRLDVAGVNDDGVMVKVEIKKLMEEARKAIKTTTVGELTPVFETKYGFHLMKVIKENLEETTEYNDKIAKSIEKKLRDGFENKFHDKQIKSYKNYDKIKVSKDKLDIVLKKLTD